MFSPKLKTAALLSGVISVLACVAAIGGLFISDLYRDNALVTSGWYGNDRVTLVLAVPLLIGALLLARRGSLRACLIWLGVLAYMLYKYAFPLFGAALHRFFLVYIALVMLSMYALIFGLAHLDVTSNCLHFRCSISVKWISGNMPLCAAYLGGAWIFQSLQFAITGQLSSVVVQTGGTTTLVAALDICPVVSSFAAGGFWLWQRRPWGSALQCQWRPLHPGLHRFVDISSAAELVPLWAVLDVGSLSSCGLLLWNLRPAKQDHLPLSICKHTSCEHAWPNKGGLKS